MYRRTRQSQSKLPPDTVDSSPRTRQSVSKPPPDTVDSSSSDMHRRTRQSQSKLRPDTVDGSPRTRQSKSKPPPDTVDSSTRTRQSKSKQPRDTVESSSNDIHRRTRQSISKPPPDTVDSSPRTRQSKSKPPPDTVESSSNDIHQRTRQSISKPPPDTVDSSSTTRQSISKPPPDTVDSSSSDSDSDNYQNHLSASDVINSFLQPNRTVVHVYTPRCRKASDVVNSFLQKSKTVDRASPSQYDSALDVINSYLRRDNFGKNGTSVGVLTKRECSDSSSSESDPDTEFLANKRRRRMTESSTSDSDSDANPSVPKKRRIEDSGAENATTASIVNGEPIRDMKIEPDPSSSDSAHDESSDAPENPTPSTTVKDGPSSTTSTTVNEGPLSIHAPTAEDPEHSKGDQTEVPAQKEVNPQSTSISTRRRTLRSHASKENTPLQNVNKTMSKRKAPAFFQMTFKREVVSKKMRTRRIIEQQTTIRDYQIPKEKYDRALDMLNAVECRYDETPVDYNAPRLYYDFRQNCNRRRHAEATYDTDKIAIPAHSLTRIVCELDNCLKTENWSRMAELIYFGCGLMKTDHIRRAIGGAFFTYALLLLILDSSTNSISTLSGKRSEIQKFLTALGNDPEDTEEFLKQLHLVTNENDTPNGLLTIKCEEE